MIHTVSEGVNLMGNQGGTYADTPSRLTLRVIHMVSEGVNLMGNHRDTYADTANW